MGRADDVLEVPDLPQPSVTPLAVEHVQPIPTEGRVLEVVKPVIPKASAQGAVLSSLGSYDAMSHAVDLSTCDMGTVGYVADLLHTVLSGDEGSMQEIPHVSLESVRKQIVGLREKALDAMQYAPALGALPLPVKVRCVVDLWRGGIRPSVATVTISGYSIDDVSRQVAHRSVVSSLLIQLGDETVETHPEGDRIGAFLHTYVVRQKNGKWVIVTPSGQELCMDASALVFSYPRD